MIIPSKAIEAFEITQINNSINSIRLYPAVLHVIKPNLKISNIGFTGGDETTGLVKI